jgi:hypothetical protein
MVWLAWARVMTGDTVEPGGDLDRALAVVGESGIEALLRAYLARERDEWEEAEFQALRAFEISQQSFPQEATVGMTAGFLAWVKRDSGDAAAAVEYLHVAADFYEAAGNVHGTVYVVESLLTMAADLGRYDLGARLHGAATAFRTRMAEVYGGYDMHDWEAVPYRASLGEIRRRLAPAAFDAAVSEGSEWTLEEALAAAQPGSL